MAASTKAELKEPYIPSSSETVFYTSRAPFAKTSEKTKTVGRPAFYENGQIIISGSGNSWRLSAKFWPRRPPARPGWWRHPRRLVEPSDGSVWAKAGYPALLNNDNISQTLWVNSITKEETLLWSRAEVSFCFQVKCTTPLFAHSLMQGPGLDFIN